MSFTLSSFCWRFYLYFTYPKEISGIIFIAFAICSFPGTFFNNVLGPNFFYNKITINSKIKYFFITIFICLIIYNFITYQNISLVGRSLIESKIDSIIFLTSAYHSRRSLLLWNKNFPNIDVHAVRPSDAPNKSMQWGVSADKIKVILYEYAAIIFNWMKGWL